MLNEETDDDITTRYAKAAGPLDISGYDREILKLTTVNSGIKPTASR